jgi:vancomycin resistance protein YoaR
MLAQPERHRLPRGTRVMMRVTTTAASVVAMFMLAGLAGLILYGVVHADRIYEGVELGGVRVGGMTESEANAALTAHFETYADTPMTLTAGDQTFTVTPREAGISLNREASARDAFEFGRSGSIWSRTVDWARGLLYGQEISPRIEVDIAQLDAKLHEIAPQIIRAPVDAHVAMDGDAQPTLVPDSPAIAFDLAASRALVIDRLMRLQSEPVSLVTIVTPAAVTAEMLAPSLPQAQAAVSSSLVLTAGEQAWTVPAEVLRQIVSVRGGSDGVVVNQAPLEETIRGIAEQINHGSVDAGITVDDDGNLAVVPGLSSAAVNVKATVNNVVAGLESGVHDVEIVVLSNAPQITDEEATVAVAEAEALIASGVDLAWSDGDARLGRDDLLAALTITPQPEKEQPFLFDFDPGVVASLLGPVAEEIDIQAKDARFRLVDGQITLVAEASSGQALDLDGAVESVIDAAKQHKPKVDLTVNPTEPRFTADAKDDIVLPDVLGDSSTSYAGSSAPRKHNVENAVSLENGWLVPPDGVFSYDENVGKADEAAGFVTGFGIVANETGGVTTAPVVAGGICQVSTTIFQAAFWAGLKIEERWQHPYWLTSYGQPPRGMKGLDAMVNIEEDWQLDMKFRNTTDHWIAVVVVADGETVSAKIMGTNPGWTVSVDGPTITNVITPDEEMHYTDSTEIPAGQELVVEHAQEGFDAEIVRTVTKDGQVIDEYTMTSSFAPSRNTTLRGTGS